VPCGPISLSAEGGKQEACSRLRFPPSSPLQASMGFLDILEGDGSPSLPLSTPRPCLSSRSWPPSSTPSSFALWAVGFRCAWPSAFSLSPSTAFPLPPRLPARGPRACVPPNLLPTPVLSTASLARAASSMSKTPALFPAPPFSPRASFSSRLNRFFTAYPLRPSNCAAILDQAVPMTACHCRICRSSSAVHVRVASTGTRA
jgi:hypothetical protein